jgi:hypothetical protein
MLVGGRYGIRVNGSAFGRKDREPGAAHSRPLRELESPTDEYGFREVIVRIPDNGRNVPDRATFPGV